MKTKQELIDRVLEVIESDIRTGDLTAVDELLSFLPIENLIGYLSEDEWQYWESLRSHCNDNPYDRDYQIAPQK